MKKRFIQLGLVILVLTLSSWGHIGHQTIGVIAERHLTAKSKIKVQEILNGKSLSEVSNWADEVRDDKTSPQHFVNVAYGLTRKQFEHEVLTQVQENIHKAILTNLLVLKNSSSTKADKEKALKFLVHFLGDLHQPLHVTPTEVRGGSHLLVTFNGINTNLHSVWDNKILDRQALNSTEIADRVDIRNKKVIRQIPSGSPMDWLWESYQLSSGIIADVKTGYSLNDSYYHDNITTVTHRLERGGIRLAFILNQVFDNTN
jgi:hypothetical protein